MIPIAMPVEVQSAVTAAELPATKRISSWADTVIRFLDGQPDVTDVCVRIVEEDEARALNATYRGKDKPTNVLSFAADVVVPGHRVLGDLVICLPVVRDEAAAQGKALESHFAHMVVHGMLHLYGYDHESAEDADVMEGIEREILGSIGIGDPYEAR